MQTPNQWHAEGLSFYNRKQYDEAIRCYDEALKLDPQNIDAWYAIGGVLHKKGQHDEAIRCYDEALKLDPQYKEAWSSKANVFKTQGQYDEALHCYIKALSIDPSYVEASEAKKSVEATIAKQASRAAPEASNQNLTSTFNNASIFNPARFANTFRVTVEETLQINVINNRREQYLEIKGDESHLNPLKKEALLKTLQQLFSDQLQIVAAHTYLIPWEAIREEHHEGFADLNMKIHEELDKNLIGKLQTAKALKQLIETALSSITVSRIEEGKKFKILELKESQQEFPQATEALCETIRVLTQGLKAEFKEDSIVIEWDSLCAKMVREFEPVFKEQLARLQSSSPIGLRQ